MIGPGKTNIASCRNRHADRPCLRRVPGTVRIRSFHCRPMSERLPCVVRRSITAARTPRSAGPFVGETPGSNRNRSIAAPCLTRRLANVQALDCSPAAQLAPRRNTQSLMRKITPSPRHLASQAPRSVAGRIAPGPAPPAAPYWPALDVSGQSRPAA